MRDLIIVGAGGSSQQIACAVEDINQREPLWNLLGFLDDDPAKQHQTVGGIPVLGPVAAANNYPGHFIIGLASTHDLGRRREVFGRIGIGRDRFATIIHPSANVSRHARVGAGTAILQNVVITQNTRVGDHVIILHNVSIGHDVSIDNFVTVAPGAVVAGWAQLRAGCFIGAASAVNNGRVVNEGAIVGLGAVIVRDVPAGVTVVGDPAHPLPRQPAPPIARTA